MGSAYGIRPVTCRPAFRILSESRRHRDKCTKACENHAIKRSEKQNSLGGARLALRSKPEAGKRRN